MKYALAAILAFVTLSSSPASAARHYYSGKYSRYLARHHHYVVRHRFHHNLRHYARQYLTHVRLSRACQSAASMGGPCGCVAEEKIFGRSDHVLNGWNPWLANEWLRWPRSAPMPGTAAVWPGRHVEAVVRNNGDGTITTDGPYGIRRVSLRAVVIVNPHPAPRRTYKVAGAWPL